MKDGEGFEGQQGCKGTLIDSARLNSSSISSEVGCFTCADYFIISDVGEKSFD